MTETRAESTAPCTCKVGTVSAEFGIEDIHDELRREWGAEDGPSVRSLADTFNKRVLRAAFRRAGRLPIDGEIDNIYRILTDEEADAGSRTRAREQLRQDGIPIEEIEAQLISHQTLYRHLVDCLDADHERPDRTDQERIETWRDRLLALQNRTNSVTERGIEQLRDSHSVDIGSFDVMIDVNVLCEDCGGFYTLEEFLDRRTCDCDSAGER